MISFSYALLLNAHVWIPLIMESFMTVDASVLSMPRLDPSTVFAQGVGLGNRLLVSLISVSGLFEALVPTLVGVFAALMTVFAFALVAGQLVLALVESHIVIGIGGVFAGLCRLALDDVFSGLQSCLKERRQTITVCYDPVVVLRVLQVLRVLCRCNLLKVLIFLTKR